MTPWGIPAVLLFGIPEHKDTRGSSDYSDDGVIQRAIKHIKDTCPHLQVITDVCMCEYTDHGHCGIINADGTVDNDAAGAVSLGSPFHAKPVVTW